MNYTQCYQHESILVPLLSLLNYPEEISGWLCLLFHPAHHLAPSERPHRKAPPVVHRHQRYSELTQDLQDLTPMSHAQTRTYLTSWDIESSGHNLLVLRGGLMLSHGILQAPHGLNVSLVHKLPHLQHLTGPGVQMGVLQSRGSEQNTWQSVHVSRLTWVQPGTPWRHCNCPCSNSTLQHWPDRRTPLSSLPWILLSESARLPMSSPVDKDIYKWWWQLQNTSVTISTSRSNSQNSSNSVSHSHPTNSISHLFI